MGQKKILYYCIVCIGLAHFNLIAITKKCGKEGIVVVPVADLTLANLKTLYGEKNTKNLYNSLPFEGKRWSSQACPRAHQLLFNEQVTIIRKQGDEILIEIPNVFYTTNKGKQHRYWTHKKNIIELEKLKKKGIDLTFLPQPIDFSTNIYNTNQNTVTIVEPFHNRKTGQTYSAGTRFVKARNTNKKGTIPIFALNTNPFRLKKMNIPKKICSLKKHTPSEKRKQFVHILKKWAHLHNGFIPYVWGGCSFTKPYKRGSIQKKLVTVEKKQSIHVFAHKNKNHIAKGFDCTGLVVRAAQICEIPYFFKNSSTVAHSLDKLNRYDDLQNGDILHINGHIMVVSNIEKNKIIEARSHGSGFGKVQEISLGALFQNIKNYKQLFATCKNKKLFIRLDSQKKATKKITGRFLKLPA